VSDYFSILTLLVPYYLPVLLRMNRWQPQAKTSSTAPSASPFIPPTTPPAPRPPPPPPPAANKVSEKIVVALFDHEIETDDELPFSKGEKILVLDSSDEGWWKGKNTNTGKVGIFPVNYVKPEE
jgi:hypothetical protein